MLGLRSVLGAGRVSFPGARDDEAAVQSTAFRAAGDCGTDGGAGQENREILENSTAICVFQVSVAV